MKKMNLQVMISENTNINLKAKSNLGVKVPKLI